MSRTARNDEIQTNLRRRHKVSYRVWALNPDNFISNYLAGVEARVSYPFRI